MRGERQTYIRLAVLLDDQGQETNVADLCEDKAILVAAVCEEWYILHSQSTVALFPVLLHEVHDLLQLWALQHFIDRYGLWLLNPRLENSSQHDLEFSLLLVGRSTDRLTPS